MLDVCAIGNALVDMLVSVDDETLTRHDVAKGAMTLVDEPRITYLQDNVGTIVETSSGGSAANTLAGFASLGGACAYLGKVGQDKFGEMFSDNLRAQGIGFTSAPSASLATGRCLVLVTPDAQRSMNTFLGAAVDFASDDVASDIVREASITYLEGYLFDKPTAQKAFVDAAAIARAAGRKAALTLSDVFCVNRHRAAFAHLIEDGLDIVFANENEVMAIYETHDALTAFQALRGGKRLVVMTRGARGAVAACADEVVEIPAYPVASVVDTTGAGDLFAAGFLFGLSRHKTLAECGRLGARAAAEVIGHYGPRPQVCLKELV